MRHLTGEQALAYLRLGKTLEQWLGTRPVGDDKALRWMSVQRQSPTGYLVTLFEGEENERAVSSLYNIYSLELDQDGARQPVDATPKEFILPSEDAVVAFVEGSLGGSRERFVNEGLVQQEYLDTLAVGGGGV
jgi:hypothetical protein